MYPEQCFADLVGIRGTCQTFSTAYWVDDIPGIDINKLAMTAEAATGTGEKLGMKLIDAAARMAAADIEAIYDAQYKVQNQLVGGCSVCKFTTNYSAGTGRGIMIKNNTTSAFASILLDKLTVKMNSTGTFTVIITDGEKSQTFEYDFEAGVEYDFENLNFKTKRKWVKVYFQENDPLLSVLSCPVSSSGCGCSGSTAVISDLTFTGLANGIEQKVGYGFLPCAAIVCDAADLLCFVAHSAPRMVGMAILFKTAELYFDSLLHSLRNNKLVGTNTDGATADVKKYQKLYTDKLNGVGTRGVKDVVFTTLSQTKDSCVVCNALIGSAWATG